MSSQGESSLFKEYPSILNHYNEQQLSHPLFQSALKGLTFCATEKIDGSNVSFIIAKGQEGYTVQRASRSKVLTDKDAFFSLPDIQKMYEAKLIRLWEVCAERYAGNGVVRVYGELYGGHWPISIVGSKKHRPLQDKIYYSPFHHFRAFDILINDGNFLPYKEVIDLLQTVGIPYAPVLHQGTFESMMQLSPVFLSTIPSLLKAELSVGIDEAKANAIMADALNLDLPELKENYSEGYVLKPFEVGGAASVVLMDDEPVRLIVKLKNPKFNETLSAAGQNNKQKKEKIAKGNEPTDLPPPLSTLCVNCVNDNRYNAVVSKMTEDERDNRGKVISAMSADVLKEVCQIESIPKSDPKVKSLQKFLSKKVADFVANKFAPKTTVKGKEEE